MLVLSRRILAALALFSGLCGALGFAIPSRAAADNDNLIQVLRAGGFVIDPRMELQRTRPGHTIPAYRPRIGLQSFHSSLRRSGPPHWFPAADERLVALTTIRLARGSRR
jgi:hypothetical protein